MGAGQVAGAIISSTLTTVCVFLPIVFVEGISRQLFADMGLTIAYSLLASLIVALTLVPSMCATVMKKSGEKPHRIFDAFQRGYGRLLRGSLRIKPLVLLLRWPFWCGASIRYRIWAPSSCLRWMAPR